ncbi:MAG: DUF362 domain-containing protein, partial [Candidatus Hodarchaeota archaeon]
EAIVEEVNKCGGRPIIGDSSGFEFDTETTFKILGVHEFGRRMQVEVLNLDACRFTKIKLQKGLIKEVQIPELVQKANVLINVPKFKRHSLTKVSLGIKNLFGLLARESRRKIHAVGLERGIFELARVIKCNLTIVDGSVVTERAVYGRHHPLGLVVGSTDVYAADMHCCHLLKVNHKNVEHIRLALDEGLAQERYDVIFLSSKDGEHKFCPTLHYQEDGISRKVHRLGYQLMYLCDIPYSRIRGGQSLIPKAHFYFGIRPKLDPRKCTDCGDCLAVCPQNAIQLSHRRIVASLCEPVRCLKCFQVCKKSAISVHGYQARDISKSLNKIAYRKMK